MMQHVLLSAVLTAAALVPPAVADDAAEYAGLSCSFTSTNDPSGAVQQNPDVQFGEMTCGPWMAADWNREEATPNPHVPPGTVRIDMCGWIQINNPTPSAPAIPTATVCQSSDTVVYAAAQIQYTAATTDNVYLCTRVDMTHDGHPTETVIFDEDDDPTNGVTCPLAISAGA